MFIFYGIIESNAWKIFLKWFQFFSEEVLCFLKFCGIRIIMEYLETFLTETTTLLFWVKLLHKLFFQRFSCKNWWAVASNYYPEIMVKYLKNRFTNVKLCLIAISKRSDLGMHLRRRSGIFGLSWVGELHNLVILETIFLKK